MTSSDHFTPRVVPPLCSIPSAPNRKKKENFIDEYTKVLPELYQQNFSNLCVNGVIITEKKMGLYVLTFFRHEYGTAATLSFAATP